MLPQPLPLWSRLFSTTARTRSFISESITGIEVLPCLSWFLSSVPKTSAMRAGTASRPSHRN